MSRWEVQGIEASVDGFRLGPVSFAIDPGRALVVLGSSGAGKTTLLRTIAGFVPTSAGRIVRDGVDLGSLPPEARGLGYVPQGLGLLPHRSVAANVRYPLELRDRPGSWATTERLLDRFELRALAHRYPAQLSGGEQQRVALARAVAAEPSLIVWDEPWQGLDVLARDSLGSILRDLREVERVPVVVVTHDPSLAFSIGDEFLVLDRGTVRTRCDAATLLRRPVDRFVARFVGLENVFDRSGLSASGPGPLARWLLERSGRDGVAFPRPVPIRDGGAASRWEGRVERVLPGPDGLVLRVDSDGLSLSLLLPRSEILDGPTAGRQVRFDLDPSIVHPLGPVDGPPGGSG